MKFRHNIYRPETESMSGADDRNIRPEDMGDDSGRPPASDDDGDGDFDCYDYDGDYDCDIDEDDADEDGEVIVRMSDEETPPPVRTVIIEDDEISVKVLSKALDAYGWIEQAGVAYDVDGAVDLIHEVQPQLIFLDIELNDESGLDVLDELDRIVDEDTRVVFYTAYTRYMIKALRMQAFDFLLKPLDRRELALMLERYRLHSIGTALPLHPESTTVLSRMSGGYAEIESKRSVTITTVTNERLVVTASDIIFFKYDTTRKIWEAILKNMQRYILKRHTNADTLLGLSSRFVRTHKTYIVNTSYLSKISGGECELLPPFNNICEIKISRTYRRGLLDSFYDL